MTREHVPTYTLTSMQCCKSTDWLQILGPSRITVRPVSASALFQRQVNPAGLHMLTWCAADFTLVTRIDPDACNVLTNQPHASAAPTLPAIHAKLLQANEMKQ